MWSGPTLPHDAAPAAVLWPAALTVAAQHESAVQRALGSTASGRELGAELFDRILDSPSGTAFTHHEYAEVWDLVRHRDRRVHLVVDQLVDWFHELVDQADEDDPAFPFVLLAGQRRSYNANQIIRNPAWRKDDLDGSLRVHPDDLAEIGGTEGGWVRVVTRTGSIVVRAATDADLLGRVMALPHGYGQRVVHPSAGRVQNGPRITN